MLDLERPVRSVAIIGNYVPRRCGIATFTKDTAEALLAAGIRVHAVAMSDHDGYDYPEPVLFDIPQDDLSAYAAAASKLNAGGYDLVSLQHEFGIFGGTAGAHILTLLRELKMPIVSTFHTVLAEPNEYQREVLEEIASLSERIVVMSEKASSLLQSVHRISAGKIDVIPHGIPDLPEESAADIKDTYGLAGKKVVLTFGLLSPDKGIEFAIEALAEVPDAVFVIAGQTHPHIVRHSGEAYRERLVSRANELGVIDRIKFIDRFVDDQELGRLLKMADVYVSAYQKEQQITSGTLAYTVGNGKAVISTPYWHAAELLADGRGILVPFRNSEAMASAMTTLLTNDESRQKIEKLAYEMGRDMRWPAVADQLIACFNRAAGEGSQFLHAFNRLHPSDIMQMPEIQITHLERLTDDTGIFQHARQNIPKRREGYCVDDNCRALMAAVMLEEAGVNPVRMQELQANYLSFCEHAFNKCAGRFRNFMSYDRRWLERAGSEDSHGRTMWALAYTAKHAKDPGFRRLAVELFHCGMRVIDNMRSPRAITYSLLGFEILGMTEQTAKFAGHIRSMFEANGSEEWPWFEDKVSYDNARIAQALMIAGKMLGDQDLIDVGLRALDWLAKVQSFENYYSPIGNAGFYQKGSQPAVFDQQPIEAAGHLSASLTAYELTGDAQWMAEAEKAFGWFLGRNVLRMPIADISSGGCRDGLSRYGVNENQGAESTLSWLMALAEMRTARPAESTKPSLI